nr:serine/threonine-protein kinase [Actinomadura bangladeshensis]
MVAHVAGSPDELVGGRYRLVELVGQGGMGRVWRGHDDVLDRPVAVKQILLHGGLTDGQRDELTRRLLREARAAARLNHPGIVTVHDVVEHDGAPAIVMEFLAGPSLASLIEQEGRLPSARVAEIGTAMLDALREAHAAGIVHRDLKPDNVLLAGRRTVITDFGIATVANATALTVSGTVLGTPVYMAPEQLEGQPAGEACDLWALGVTLYKAVEGVAPFDGPTLTALYGAVLTKEPRPTEHAGPLAEILAGLLVKDPALRATAEQTADALAALSRPTPSREPRINVTAPYPDDTIEGVPDKPTRLWQPDTDHVGQILEGHTDTVRDLAFSPGGSTLATVGLDKTVRIWDVATGRTTRTFEGHGKVEAVAFSPDGKVLATGHHDGKARLWDLTTGLLVHTFKRLKYKARSVAFSPDGAALATAHYGATRIWNLASRRSVTLKGDYGAGTLAYTADGALLAADTWVWDVKTGRRIHMFDNHESTVLAVAFSPDGSTLAGGNKERTVRLWNLRTGSITVLEGHSDAVNTIAYSPDGTVLATGSSDGTVRLWDVATASTIRTITAHTSPVHAIAYNPDGTLLASTGEDRAIHLSPMP